MFKVNNKKKLINMVNVFRNKINNVKSKLSPPMSFSNNLIYYSCKSTKIDYETYLFDLNLKIKLSYSDTFPMSLNIIYFRNMAVTNHSHGNNSKPSFTEIDVFSMLSKKKQ